MSQLMRLRNVRPYVWTVNVSHSRSHISINPAVQQKCSIINARFSSDLSKGQDESYPEIPSGENPLKRVYRLFMNDMKNLRKGRFIIPDEEFFPSFCDVVIIGGGAIGSSIAFWLKQRVGKGLKVVVVEQDPTYAQASTTLSAGGIRQQFSLPENIQMSLFGVEFLRDIQKHLSVEGMEAPDAQFQPQGYLLLAPESGVDILKENNLIQKELGARVELLSPQKLKETFPWLNTDGIAMGSYGYGYEGWFDPYLLLMALKRKAQALGTYYVTGKVNAFEMEKIRGIKIIEDDVEIPYRQIRKVVVTMKNGETEKINAALVIIAGGAHSGQIGQLAGIGSGLGLLERPIPVEPRKRYVYVIDSPNGPGIDCPVLIDSTGAYFKRMGLGTTYICGKSPNNDTEEPDTSTLEVDYAYFEDVVWPLIAHRVPTFENIKLKTAWAGYYDYNTFDQNALIGNHPHFGNLSMATGFSGHGIQQAPAVGRAMMELIVYGKFQTIDLSRFAYDRVLLDEPVYERNII